MAQHEPSEPTHRITESEEVPVCLQNYILVIYTHGEENEDQTFSRGRLEALPLQHRCIFGTIQNPNNPVLPLNLSDEDEMEGDIGINPVVVVDLGLDDDIAEQMLTLDRNIHPPYSAPYELLSFEASGYSFMDRRVFEAVPLMTDAENLLQLAGIAPETEIALTRRSPPSDEELACSRIKHLVIRRKDLRHRDFNAIMAKLEAGIRNEADLPLWREYLTNYCYSLLGAGLCLEWDLLQNLETLVLDLTGQLGREYMDWLEQQASWMSEYLNLKTLILVGMPCLARYDVKHSNGRSGEEFWVSYLEDIPGVPVPTPAGDGLAVIFLSFFKDLMRPGGQIHFLDHLEPGDYLWPGPVDEIEEINDGLQ
ncbi:hypothetical protein FBEOM_10050 [Fusarium beomiforme]|uniref:Uncharacterized protein n=1 Tax=Fusarium beomiforme TaxID=44412 RepID=A0A9P5ACC5_9HYPO|nr:hypothetical protein FBEOM_10050 [Fusarium beomiforme]